MSFVPTMTALDRATLDAKSDLPGVCGTGVRDQVRCLGFTKPKSRPPFHYLKVHVGMHLTTRELFLLFDACGNLVSGALGPGGFQVLGWSLGMLRAPTQQLQLF